MWGSMLRSKIPTSRRKRRGSVLIESALTLTAFTSLFLGTIDLAQVLMVHQGLVERLRLAARTVAVNCCDSTLATNMVLYGQTTAPNPAIGYFGLTSNNVQVTFAGQGTPDQRVSITVTNYNYTTFTPMLAGVSSGIPIHVSIPLELP